LALVAERKYSYEVIARMVGNGATRCIVGGVVFRNRHPRATRVKSTGARTPNMMGHGWRPPAYQPEMTARNSR
jgi:hypothetical protein